MNKQLEIEAKNSNAKKKTKQHEDIVITSLKEMEVKEFEQMPATLTVKDIKSYTRLGKNKIYYLLSIGEIPSIRVGKIYLVPKYPFFRWLYKTKHTS